MLFLTRYNCCCLPPHVVFISIFTIVYLPFNIDSSTEKNKEFGSGPRTVLLFSPLYMILNTQTFASIVCSRSANLFYGTSILL